MSKRNLHTIKEHWNNQAETYGTNPLATSPDAIGDTLEVNAIVRHLAPNRKILDVGCGNGSITFRVAKKVKSHFVGMDYSAGMIESAEKSLRKEKPELKKRMAFIVGDALQLPFKDKTFDMVFSNRCLINLPKFSYQVAAAKEIARVLKKGGVYVMSENSTTPLQNVNQLRKAVNLPTIVPPWHNLFLEEKKFFSALKRKFLLKEVDSFCSSYYLGSRVFNGKLAAMEGKKPDYNAPLNHIASMLPPVGDFGTTKIFILKRL